MLRFRGGGGVRGVGIRLSYCCRVLCLRALKGLFVFFILLDFIVGKRHCDLYSNCSNALQDSASQATFAFCGIPL